ncbi:MAG: hypothetical protein OK456_06510 [Thaumarchaeota archaeon]|nr:hypothetical protein [Nitrososphaerota archaeon]
MSGALGQNISLSAQLSVKVYNHGTLVGSATVNGDLVMNNFMNWLQGWMVYETPSGAASTFVMTDTSGTARMLYGRDSSSTTATCTWACENTVPPYAGGYIGVGTGTTAPARTDSKLGALYPAGETYTQALVPVQPPTYDPSTGNIVFGGAIIAGGSATISEAGYFENWYLTGFAVWDTFMMFHDTFAGIAVSAGNTISVQYTVQLGSVAYNNNLGILLTAIFANTLGAPSSVKLTATTGAPVSVAVYYVSPLAAPRVDLGSSATGSDSAIRIGTGSANSGGCPTANPGGFPAARNAIDLCVPALTYTQVNSFVISPYVAVTSVIPVIAPTTFTEAGYYQSFDSAYSFLLIRSTFSGSGVAVPADSSLTVTYEMSMG